MFHQVFICNTTQDPGDTTDPILEQNSLENTPQILKQENTTSGSTAMGYVQTEDLKMAVEELKSEQYSVINNQIFTKTDIQPSQVDIDTKDLLKVTPYSNTKIEPSVSFSNVSMSEEIQDEITVMKNSQLKIEREEPMEDTDLTDSGDADVQHGAVKFQECNETNKSVLWHIIRQSGGEKKEETSSTADNAEPVSKVLIERNPKSQKCCGNKSIKISDDEFKSTYHKKEFVVINRCMTQYLTPEPQYLALETIQYSSASDREENHTDVDNSSGSDWEEEYLGKLRKTKNNLEMGISCNAAQNMNISNHLQNSKDNIKVQTVSFTNVQPINAHKSDKEVMKLKLKNNQSLIVKAQNSRNETERLPLENPTLKSLLKCKAAVTGPYIVGLADSLPRSTPSLSIPEDNCDSNAKGDTNKSKKMPYQLELPFKAKVNNIKSHFIPQNKIVSITGIKNKLDINIQDQTLTKLYSINTHKKGSKNSAEIGLQQKKNIISSLKAQNTKKCTQKNIEGTVETFSPTTPPSHEGESILDDKFDDDESCSEIEPLLPQHTYYCNKCNTFFDSLNQFRRHRYSLCNGYKREARHQCNICDKRFKGIEKKEAHQNSHTNARPFKCFDCDKCFNSKVARQMHHKNIHLNKKTRYLCCFCGFITPSPEHVLAHEEEHRLPEGSEAPKPFKCLVCGKGFISRWRQQKHKREHLLKKCSKCSEEFKTYTHLRNHMEAVHSFIKTYNCKECGMQFKNANTLRNHGKTHSSILLYSCDICDKGFKRKSNLRQHMITHSDERPISCPECGESFKRITHLKQHTAAFHGDGRK